MFLTEAVAGAIALESPESEQFPESEREIWHICYLALKKCYLALKHQFSAAPKIHGTQCSDLRGSEALTASEKVWGFR